MNPTLDNKREILEETRRYVNILQSVLDKNEDEFTDEMFREILFANQHLFQAVCKKGIRESKSKVTSEMDCVAAIMGGDLRLISAVLKEKFVKEVEDIELKTVQEIKKLLPHDVRPFHKELLNRLEQRRDRLNWVFHENVPMTYCDSEEGT